MAEKKFLTLDLNGELQLVQTGDLLGIEFGGTGGSTAEEARTALGVSIGVDVQAFDADLTALAGLASTGLVARTGAGTAAARTITGPAAGITVSNGSGVSGNPTLALANDLSALEALASTGIAVRSGTDTWVQRSIAVASTARLTVSNGNGVSGNPTLDLATLTDSGAGTFLKVTVDSYGRVTGSEAVALSDISTLVDTRYVRSDADTALDSGVTIAYNAATTTLTDNDLAPKWYVDGLAAGMDWKESVRVATTANGTLASAFENGDTVDGVVLATGDRILLKNQTTGSQNGIYVVNATGAPTRADDADSSAKVTGGMTVWVNEGTANADTAWTLTTNDDITLDTTSLTFTQTSGLGQVTAGTGLTKTGNTLNVATASVSRIVVNADNIDLATVTDSGSGTFKKITVDSYGRVTGTESVVAADISALLDADLTALAGISTTGLLARTGAGTAAARTLTAPAAGITVSNGDGVSGNPTLALANDLSALEALASTGIAVRSASDTWVQRSIATASSTRITVTNGSGVSGNPTLDLASGIVTPGTYNSVTVDTYGRVTAGTTSSSGLTTVSLANTSGGSIVIGRAVYASDDGEVGLAMANATGTKDVVGLVADTSISNSASGNIATSGVLTATTTQWDAITGQSGGLTPGSKYYLSNATAGALTSTAPSTGFVVRVGIALSTTKFKLGIMQSIEL